MYVCTHGGMVSVRAPSSLVPNAVECECERRHVYIYVRIHNTHGNVARCFNMGTAICNIWLQHNTHLKFKMGRGRNVSTISQNPEAIGMSVDRYWVLLNLDQVMASLHQTEQ